jgi:hypothetical protein
MSLSNAAETAILDQVFKATALPWNANTNLWWALYTASPGEAGTAVTNETSFGGYTRIAAVRATDLTVSGNQVVNANIVTFPACTSGTATITHAGLVTSNSGAGTLIAFYNLTSSLPVQVGTTVQFAASALVGTLD